MLILSASKAAAVLAALTVVEWGRITGWKIQQVICLAPIITSSTIRHQSTYRSSINATQTTTWLNLRLCRHSRLDFSLSVAVNLRKSAKSHQMIAARKWWTSRRWSPLHSLISILALMRTLFKAKSNDFLITLQTITRNRLERISRASSVSDTYCRIPRP